MDKIYKVFSLSTWGYEDNVKYFKRAIDAEKEFYSMFKKLIKELDVPKPSDLDVEQGKPYKITCKPHTMYKKSRLFASVKYWEKTSYEYDEWDIDQLEIIFDEIEVA